MAVMITDFKALKAAAAEKLKKNRVLLIALAAGVLLLLLLPRGDTRQKNEVSASFASPEFSLKDEEEKLAAALSKIEGAGKVTVLLTLRSGMSREIAEDEKFEHKNQGDDASTSTSRSSVKLQSGSGMQEALTLRYEYPEYQGALVITSSSNPNVKLMITQAVMSLTGLTSDKVTVVKGQ